MPYNFLPILTCSFGVCSFNVCDREQRTVLGKKKEEGTKGRFYIHTAPVKLPVVLC